MSEDLRYNAALTAALTAIRAALMALVLFVCPAWALADSFSIQNQSEIKLTDEALDMAVSSDGRWTFVLTKSGDVAVYGAAGDLIQLLKVGKGFDNIEYSPAGNRLILGGSGKQELSVLTLSMLYDLDYRGSPFKGPANAPVTIAVFNDFQ
jgi:hypothetical protein